MNKNLPSQEASTFIEVVIVEGVEDPLEIEQKLDKAQKQELTNEIFDEHATTR